MLSRFFIARFRRFTPFGVSMIVLLFALTASHETLSFNGDVTQIKSVETQSVYLAPPTTAATTTTTTSTTEPVVAHGPEAAVSTLTVLTQL